MGVAWSVARQCAGCYLVGTCASPIQYVVRAGKRDFVHEGETMQMESRVRYMPFTVGLAAGDVVECSPCPRCAAELYMSGKPVPA